MPTYTQCLDVTLPEGIYDFVVGDASDKQSQSGNDMIELQLIIKGPDGQESKVYDNLVFTPGGTGKSTRSASARATSSSRDSPSSSTPRIVSTGPASAT